RRSARPRPAGTRGGRYGKAETGRGSSHGDSLHLNSEALLDPSDPADEELARLEFSLERWSLLRRQRDQQAAGGLGIEAERDDRLRRAVERHVGGGEGAGSRGAARADIFSREGERALARPQAV